MPAITAGSVLGGPLARTEVWGDLERCMLPKAHLHHAWKSRTGAGASQQRKSVGQVVCGDIVSWQKEDEETDVITSIDERNTILQRPDINGKLVLLPRILIKSLLWSHINLSLTKD